MLVDNTFFIDANLRLNLGTKKSRLLRSKHKQIPAIIYEKHQKSLAISLDEKSILKFLDNSNYLSCILELNINDKKFSVILKDIHRHPYKEKIMHIDFLQVDKDELINTYIPLKIVGKDKCIGVKEGGVINKLINEVEVRCIARKLPECLYVDISNVKLNETLFLSDISLPDGVSVLLLDKNKSHAKKSSRPILIIHTSKIVKADDNTNDSNKEEVVKK